MRDPRPLVLGGLVPSAAALVVGMLFGSARHPPARRMAAFSTRASASTGKGISRVGSGSWSRVNAVAPARRW